MTAIDFPNSPTTGQLFTVGDVTWEWTGSVWQGAGTPTPGPGVAAGGTDGQILTKTSSADYETAWEDLPESAAVISSATAPTNTSAIWFNTETGVSYVYYDGFWTSIAGSSGAPIISDTAPTSPTLGMQWFNSSTGKSYLYFSDAWIEVDSANPALVASFANATVRAAAIPTPAVGTYTHLEDAPQRLEFYNGSAWRSAFGMTLIRSHDFTTQTSVTLNNVFSAEFNNYLVEIRFTQNTTGSNITYTLVNGSTPAASNWGWQQFLMYANALTQFSQAGSQANTDLYALNPGQGSVRINLMSPFTSEASFGHATAMYQSSGAGANPSTWVNSQLNNATSYEGFRISTGAGTFTGTIRIYGMRNS